MPKDQKSTVKTETFETHEARFQKKMIEVYEIHSHASIALRALKQSLEEAYTIDPRPHNLREALNDYREMMTYFDSYEHRLRQVKARDASNKRPLTWNQLIELQKAIGQPS